MSQFREQLVSEQFLDCRGGINKVANSIIILYQPAQRIQALTLTVYLALLQLHLQHCNGSINITLEHEHTEVMKTLHKLGTQFIISRASLGWSYTVL